MTSDTPTVGDPTTSSVGTIEDYQIFSESEGSVEHSTLAVTKLLSTL